MVTNPEAIEPEPTAAERAATAVEHGLRGVIAGHERGAIRRIALYVIAGLALMFAPLPALAVGYVALVLLIGTDDLR